MVDFLLMILWPIGSASPAPPKPLLVEKTVESGLDFVHENGMAGAFHMPENMGAGGALFDADGDGDLDLLLIQGAPSSGPRPGAGDRFYRNEGLGPGGVPRFVDATAGSGLSGGQGMGVATGDVDGDGLIDLYLTRFGSNQLLHNLGGGRFEDITAAAGVDDPRWSVAATFFDLEGDGRLDLYVGNYVDWSPGNHRACVAKSGAPDYCHPSVFAPLPGRLFRNLGKAGAPRFAEVTATAGVDRVYGRGLGALALDWDGDRHLDLYVANDGNENQLWRGSGQGTFSEVGLALGCAVDEGGKSQASMGLVAEDWDQDGDFDLVIGNVQGEKLVYYRNDGQGGCVDATAFSGLGPPTRDKTTFGLAAPDLDGDGFFDLVIANGAVSRVEALASQGDPYPYGQVDQFFRGLGGGRFAPMEVPGEVFGLAEVGRGLILGDVDNDGDEDLVLTNNHGRARLFLSTLDSPHFVGARVVLGESGRERDALGARVALVVEGGQRRWRRVATDGSYASAKDPRVLFRLRPEEKVLALEVHWPDGSREIFSEAAATGRYHLLRRHQGRPLEGGKGEP